MFLVFECTWTVAGAVDLAVPNELEHTEGNSSDLFPFLIKQTSIPSMRYQQVYHASQFSWLGAQGAYITHICFRPDGASQGAVAFLTNVQINFSTTSKGPDNLSPVFAENVGADDWAVVGPAPLSISGSGGSIPNSWGVQIPLTIPFWYDPVQGNLLFDVRIYGGGFPLPSNFLLEVQVVSGDSVSRMSRIYAESIDATSANHVDTSGLVTLFQIIPIPALRIEQTTNFVVITWLVQSDPFVLQSTDKIGPQSNWHQDTNEIPDSKPFRMLALPRDSLGTTKFFRLINDSGQPASQSVVAAPLERKLIRPNTH
jgi:hypothetical protein